MDEVLRKLEERELALKKGNAGLEQQMSDLKELMKVVDSKYDSETRDLIRQNKMVENQIQSVENALRVQRS